MKKRKFYIPEDAPEEIDETSKKRRNLGKVSGILKLNNYENQGAVAKLKFQSKVKISELRMKILSLRNLLSNKLFFTFC